MSANFYANFYEVLGIDQNASILDIRKAYKDLALKFHPDKNNDAGTEEKFKLILEAHNVLIDPVKMHLDFSSAWVTHMLIANRLSSPNLSSQKISHYTSVHSVYFWTVSSGTCCLFC